MKMSGMLTRSSMACSFRPRRCRSKASPRMACRKGSCQEQGLQAHEAPLPSSGARGSNASSIHWPLRPVRPGQPSRRALTSQMGKLRPRDPPREAGKCSLRAQDCSWVAWPHPGRDLGRSLTSWSLSVFICEIGTVTKLPLRGGSEI